MALATARSESAAELLCAELSADGLPMDRAAAERVLAAFIGPRPRNEAEAARNRAARDAEVLRHAPPGISADLRSPAQVRTLLGSVGVDVPDTRAWRLRAFRDGHPLVAALLEWRKAERIATTYGYRWLDAHLGADGRLRGTWAGSDGAAGRMTASGGLHNMPAVMRQAVTAEPGHVFVRADLGQIEPRVLAAVSGDRGPRRRDRSRRPVRPGGGAARRGPAHGQGGRARRHVRADDRSRRSGAPPAHARLPSRHGIPGRRRPRRAGRPGPAYLRRPAHPDDRCRRGDHGAGRRAAGRYGRNALVQGAAAELFKMWAVTVRARGATLGARIVLCLHDELLVHTPAAHGAATAELVDACLHEAARRWTPGSAVRFISDTSVVRTWSDAKGSTGPATSSQGR